MEPIGDISEGEWSSLSGMYTAEESDFMARLLNSCPSQNDHHKLMINNNGGGSRSFLNNYHESSSTTMNMMASIVKEASYYNSSETCSSNLYRSTSTPVMFNGNYYFTGSNIHPPFFSGSSNSNSHLSMSMDFSMGNHHNTNNNDRNPKYSSYYEDHHHPEEEDCLNQEISESNVDQDQSTNVNSQEVRDQDNIKNFNVENEPAFTPQEDKNNLLLNSKIKRSRSSGDLLMKSKRNVRSKKIQKLTNALTSSNNLEEDGNINGGGNGQSTSSTCWSEEDESAINGSFLELNGGSGVSSTSCPKGSIGNIRANRGSATDPQSLYARKRRERINERLKILQNLVPNGTKVDISTMLEEAVQYVKFLQLQIKLLSSDDLWMYAPIAFNGMDLGLDLKLMTAPRQS